MTKYDLLLSRVRWLESRMRAMEAAQVRRRSKRVPAPRPTNAIVAAREKLWARYIELEMRYGHGRMKLTKLAFAVRHGLNPDEFVRFFSATDKRGIPEGSVPAVSYYRELNDAIAELEARARGGNQNQAGNARLIAAAVQ
jgi:hypothetical protein